MNHCEKCSFEYGIAKVTHVLSGGSNASILYILDLQHYLRNGYLCMMGLDPCYSSGVRACCRQGQPNRRSSSSVPVKDTIKQVEPKGTITSTPDRRSLWAIQTPQAFRRALYLKRMIVPQQIGSLERMMLR